MDPQAERIATNLRKGVLEYCVLALLSGRDMYGLELAGALMDRGLTASEGSLYPLLARMREAGAVETRWEQPEDTGGTRPRRYYAITARGRELLAVFATVWGGIAAQVESLIADARPIEPAADPQPATDTKEPS
ncbi:PadR family transcriptional regulator [Leucobacter aridicollis]|uniref:PadR family transcriptional regulator n=1 Tax=Leucobacter aridicollis TaxID=283878 RepID=UPI002168EC09|nr:PadR family transcriptional regulator [Leucobacter aridicollis]MCS3426860.1 PadR family transcriptional regulator PadR [Leucobacter aridicollis]